MLFYRNFIIIISIISVYNYFSPFLMKNAKRHTVILSNVVHIISVVIELSDSKSVSLLSFSRSTDKSCQFVRPLIASQ